MASIYREMEIKIKLPFYLNINVNPQMYDRHQSLLHFVTWDGHIEAVEYLITGFIDIDVRNDRGQTPLHYAAWQYEIEIAKLLITSGADVNAKDNKGETPLSFASLRTNKSMELLLKYYGGYND